MTEDVREKILNDIRDGYIDEWSNLTLEELFKQIEKEHKEIQAYRAIGTVEEFKALKEKEHNYDNCHNYTCRKKCEKDGYNKAIDEFAEAIRNDSNYIFDYSFGYVIPVSDIEEIAEQLKGGAT